MAKGDTESAKVTDIDNLTVSVGVLANIFGLTERSIRLKAEEGIIVRASKGRYRLVESLKNYVLALCPRRDLCQSKFTHGLRPGQWFKGGPDTFRGRYFRSRARIRRNVRKKR